MSYTKLSVSALALAAMSATTAAARDQISIVGSSTVFPYTQAVAEQFANDTGRPSPIVESTGTGGGMQIFCEGIGESHPDLTGASRAMKASEWDKCAENGVTDMTEALIGFDGLSMAVSRDTEYDWDMSLGEMYQALAAEVPVDGEWVENPYQNWSEINDSLPDTEIVVIGPPPTSGTRDAWVELAMHAGCKELDYVKNGDFDGDWVDQNCSRMRTDGPFIEAGENDNLIVQRLKSGPERARHLRLFLRVRESGLALRRQAERGGAELRHHRRQVLPGGASAVLLCEKRASRRDPRPQRVRRGIHVRGRAGTRRLPVRAWPRTAG